MNRKAGLMVSGAMALVVLVVIGGQAVPLPVSADAGATLEAPVSPMPAEQRGHGSVRQQIGWDYAFSRLGRDMPTGRGIPAGLVEAGEAYAPRSMRGVSFVLQSGDSGVSGHATQSAALGFGENSPAPGVARVHCFSTQNWIGPGYLRSGTLENPDDWNESRVLSHSWVAETVAQAPVILRRVDYVIDEKDIVMAVGLNNGKGKVPDLLASAYNVISVGRPDGEHSRGGTRVEIDGRCKPELVAPGNLTSVTTPVVAGCAAALLQGAEDMAVREPGGLVEAGTKSEVIKALLMGGAYKPEGWQPEAGKPLDPVLGAGVVDFDRSLVMQAGGPIKPGKVSKRYAWAFDSLGREATDAFDFEADTDQGEACFTLVWNRRVIGGKIRVRHPETGQEVELWNNTPVMPDFDLRLIRHEDDGTKRIVTASVSKIDNVEVVYVRDLPAGRYTLEVVRGEDDVRDQWAYALGWRIEGPTE